VTKTARKFYGFTLRSASRFTGSDIRRKTFGFTLIELLVVIAIVGVLAAVVLIAINPARRLAQARDSGRKNDVGQLATGAQAFYTTNARYPTALGELSTSGDLKQVPTNPAGCNPAYTITGNDTTTPQEAGIYVCLEAPNVTGATYWLWSSTSGSAREVTTIPAP